MFTAGGVKIRCSHHQVVEDPQGSDELLTAIDLRSSDQAAALHLHAAFLT